MPPLRIALLAHLRNPIAPPFRGGVEAQCWHVARGLRARGHEVTLYAAGDSDAGVPLRAVIPEHYDRSFPWHQYRETEALTAYQDDAYAAILGELTSGRFDVVHNHTMHRYPPRLARRDRLPMVTTLHVPPFDALWRAVQASAAPWSRFTVPSRRQREAWWPGSAPPQAHVVPNGIDVDAWPFSESGDGSAVWAGRMTATKGAHLAAEAARIAGMPLTLFGAVDHRAYFDAEVVPRLGGGVRYGGHLSPRELAAEFGRASVLVFTPLWDEPFGLVAAEAMACGLPVAATDMGAVREVVGPCGRYAPPDDPHALAAAMIQAAALPRGPVRDDARDRFGLDRMLGAFESLYDAARAGRTAPAPDVDFAEKELPSLASASPVPG